MIKKSYLWKHRVLAQFGDEMEILGSWDTWWRNLLRLKCKNSYCLITSAIRNQSGEYDTYDSKPIPLGTTSIHHKVAHKFEPSPLEILQGPSSS